MPGAGANGGSSGRPAPRTAATPIGSPGSPPAFADRRDPPLPRTQLLQRALGAARLGPRPAHQAAPCAPTPGSNLSCLCRLRREVLQERPGPGSVPLPAAPRWPWTRGARSCPEGTLRARRPEEERGRQAGRLAGAPLAGGASHWRGEGVSKTHRPGATHPPLFFLIPALQYNQLAEQTRGGAGSRGSSCDADFGALVLGRD